ncbi:MAG: serpin family protein [Pseudomonadota bacterium]
MLRNLKRNTAIGAMLLCVPYMATSDASAVVSAPDALSRQLLSAADTGQGNTVVSPLSLAAVVALSRAGLDEAPLQPDMPDSVSMAYALWLDEGMVPSETAAEVLESGWGAKVEELDLAKDGKAVINAWAKEATNGIIETLIQDPLSQATLVLTNALHFKDAWASQFNPDQTAPKPFTLTDGNTVDVAFMTGNKTFPCWEVDGRYVVAMPFASGGHLLLSMPMETSDATDAEVAPEPTEAAAEDIIMDPVHDGDTNEIASGETADTPAEVDLADDPATDPVVEEVAKDSAVFTLDDAQLVRLSLPKLDLSADLDLSQLLKETGLQDDFLEGLATLTVAPALPGPVLQSVVFDADEFGAEAAAATAAIGVRSIQTTSAPLLEFNRPFELFLMMPDTGTALIAASVRDPR